MKFGKVDTRTATGSILAHSLRLSMGRIRKGTILNSSHIEDLVSNNIDEVTVARLEEGDVHEDVAALKLAQALVGPGIKLGNATTGRVNCYANTTGLLSVPRELLLAVNGISETITASTLQENRWVEAGKMVATIKIIPYAVPKELASMAVDTCAAVYSSSDQSNAKKSSCLNKLGVHRAKTRNAHLVQTTMQDMPTSILDKTERVTTRRLALRNVQLESSTQCSHETNTLVEHLKSLSENKNALGLESTRDWILISGASAISDRHDVIPQAVELAGGTITRCGIPVDPGNLLMIGELGSFTVIGIPGCARSPKHNGLDLFMDRLACDLPITNDWINSLAIGGLMDEIVDRPTPRLNTKQMNTSLDDQNVITPANTTVILLAGGSSKRFGTDNKLFAERNGKPLIAHALDNIANSDVQHLVVVLGHEASEVKHFCENQLKKYISTGALSVEFTVNVDFDSGMGSSLKTGVSALLNQSIKDSPSHPQAALICLADMPSVKPSTINALVSAVNASRIPDALGPDHIPASAFIPTFNGHRGNPVLLMPELFDLLLDLSGDFGARQLLKENQEAIKEIPVDDPGIFLDCDTPEQLHT